MSAPPEKRRELGGSSSNSNLKKSAISKTPNYRVLIIGDQCGKSSILDVLMGGKFGPRHSTTVEEKIDFNFTCEDKSIVRLSFIDTSGALDSYSEILDKWFSEADLCLVVYSIASKPSFFGSQILLHRLRSRTPVLPTIVIRNQLDRKAERSVSVEQGKEISKDLTFLECSAKTGENIPALGNIIVALAKKYVGSGIRHNCVLKFFASPTWCKICNKFIWGVLEKQGYECSECKLTTHKKCSKLLFHNCTGEPRSPKMTPQKSVQTLRMSEFVREVVNDNLHDTLQDPKTLEAFRIFLKNSSISGLLHLELWLKLVEYHDLPKARRRDYAMVVYKTFFTKHDDYDPKLFMIKQEDIDTKVKEEKWDELMGGLEQLMFKRLESEFFPRFVKKELRKTFSGVEGFSLEDSFKDLRLAAHNFSKEDASSETNTDTISDTSSETSEEYASGTFVISEAVDQPPDSLPSINAQPEDWEINILALEKGEYIEGMSPDAFKKYAKQRPRLPSMFIKPGRYDK